jgi:hypothetical protein
LNKKVIGWLLHYLLCFPSRLTQTLHTNPFYWCK